MTGRQQRLPWGAAETALGRVAGTEQDYRKTTEGRQKDGRRTAEDGRRTTEGKRPDMVFLRWCCCQKVRKSGIHSKDHGHQENQRAGKIFGQLKRSRAPQKPNPGCAEQFRCHQAPWACQGWPKLFQESVPAAPAGRCSGERMHPH